MSIYYCYRCAELKDDDEDGVYDFHGDLICEDCAEQVGIIIEDDEEPEKD